MIANEALDIQADYEAYEINMLSKMNKPKGKS